MGDLTLKQGKFAFQGFLQIQNGTTGLDASLRDVEGGLGQVVPFQLSTSAVKATSNMTIIGDLGVGVAPTGGFKVEITGETLSTNGFFIDNGAGLKSLLNMEGDNFTSGSLLGKGRYGFFQISPDEIAFGIPDSASKRISFGSFTDASVYTPAFTINGDNTFTFSNPFVLSADNQTLTIDGRNATTVTKTGTLEITGARSGDATAFAEINLFNLDSGGTATQYAAAAIRAFDTDNSADDGELRFFTADTSGVLQERITIANTGLVTINNNLNLLDETSSVEDPTLFIQSFAGAGLEGGTIRYKYAQGTQDTPTIIPNTGIYGDIVYDGHNGTDFIGAAIIRMSVDGTVSGTSMPSKFSFFTVEDGTNSLVERFTIRNNGEVVINGNLNLIDETTSVEDPTLFLQSFAGAGTEGGTIRYRYAQGTQASPTIIPNNGVYGDIVYDGHNGTNFIGAAIIRMSVDGTVSGTSMPSKFSFFTVEDGTNSLVERFTIRNNGEVVISGSLTVNGANITGNGPAFVVRRDGSFTTGTAVPGTGTLDFDTIDLDTDSAFTLATDRFQPSIADWYQFSASAKIDPSGGESVPVTLRISRNDSATAANTLFVENTGTAERISVSGKLFLNGTTDYVTLRGFVNGGTGFIRQNSINFTGHRIIGV